MKLQIKWKLINVRVSQLKENPKNPREITEQVASKLMKELNPKGVAVVLKAKHLCMSMRGINKPNAKTITSKLKGQVKKLDLKPIEEVKNETKVETPEQKQVTKPIESTVKEDVPVKEQAKPENKLERLKQM